MFKRTTVLGVLGSIALAIGLGAGLAGSAQASTLPVIPEANLSLTCAGSHPYNILFTDVQAGRCSVITGGNAFAYHTSGILGVKSGGSIRWYWSSSTSEDGVGYGFHIAAENLPVIVQVYAVSSYHGEKFFTRISVFWPKGAPAYGAVSHYRWTGRTWAWYR